VFVLLLILLVIAIATGTVAVFVHGLLWLFLVCAALALIVAGFSWLRSRRRLTAWRSERAE
jgi:uncharacterized protein (TIGR03382 family)